MGYTESMAVSRDDLRRFLDGHRHADAVLRRLALHRLRTLTVEQARAEYDALVRTWEMSSRGQETAGVLDRRAIAQRVAFRRRLTGRR